MTYYFGIYHWRRRLRTLGRALAMIVVAAVVWRLVESRSVRALAIVAAIGPAVNAIDAVERLTTPPPWAFDREKYAALGSSLPYDDAERALDVGCGTGRSLVGLAPFVPDGCDLLGIDVFDDRVILGNGPELARENAMAAGLDADLAVGDAARLPVEADTVDVATACRVLHDLPVEDAQAAVRELRRVLGADGTLGVLELPVTHDGTSDPVEYWQGLLADGGFDVREVRPVRDEEGALRYVVLIAEPVGS